MCGNAELFDQRSVEFNRPCSQKFLPASSSLAKTIYGHFSICIAINQRIG